MLKLEKSQIHLQQDANTKHEALLLAGQKMIDAGLVSEPYTQGLVARELVASTFLDHGIAIPHGMPEYRDAIKKTGIVVLQFPDGVDWGNGNQAFLAFAIAAHTQDHLNILGGLARVLDNRALCSQLASTCEADAIVQAIEGRSRLSSNAMGCRPLCERGWAQKSEYASGVLEREFIIRNANGFHARCCSSFISALEPFDVRVDVRNASKDGHYVNGRSLVKLLGLELVKGERLSVRVTGHQAGDALNDVERIIRDC